MAGDLIQTPQTRWIHGAYESVQRGTQIILLGTVDNGVGEARFSRLVTPGGTTAYQVPSGNTLIITQLIYQTNLAGSMWVFGDSTADPGDNQLAAPANAAAHTATTTSQEGVTPMTAINTQYITNVLLQIPALRYPFIRCNNSSARIQVMARGILI